jgi:membrane protease YdiL (CAAX protease family)
VAEPQSIHRFFRYYGLLGVYFVARQLAARGPDEPRLPQHVLLNYTVPLAIVAWANRTREPSLQRYGLAFSEPRQVLLHSAAGAALASAFVLRPAGKRMLGVRDEWEQSFAEHSPVEAAVLLGLTGFTEEVIWRGWVFAELEEALQGRRRATRAVAAIGGSALLFSLFHLTNLVQWPRRRLGPELQQMAAAGALGVIGGYWRWSTGSIIPAMVTHTTANLLRWRQMAETVRRRRLQMQTETTAGAE